MLLTRYLLLLLFASASLMLRAQLCTGSLSDPVIAIDYGAAGASGPNYGPALGAGETTYSYVATNNVVDGQYTIATSPHLARPEWHNSPDNTPDDQNGYMFIVNADIVVGEFYRSRVTGLCENTIFEFSARVQNVLPPSICGGNGIDPDVRFEIRDVMGNLLASTNTGPIAETANPLWQKFGVSLVTGAGMTEVDVIMLNNAPGGCGNDLAIDDIEFRACGDNASIIATIPGSGICDGDVNAATITAQLDGTVYGSPVFKWQRSIDMGTTWTDVAGATTASLLIDPLVDGHQYRFRVAESDPNLLNTNCSVISEVFTVTIHSIPEINLSIPSPLCEGENLDLAINSDKTLVSTVWTLPDGSTVNTSELNFNPIVLGDSGSYQLDIEDVDGCINSQPFVLNVSDTSFMQQSITGCVGEEIMLPDLSRRVITGDEDITTVLTKSNGCDSTIVTQIIANQTYDYAIDTIVCRSSVLTLPDGSQGTINSNVSLRYSFLTAALCDSIVTKNITVPQDVIQRPRICEGQSFQLPDGSKVSPLSDQSYRHVLNAVSHSCDSVVITELTVLPEKEETIFLTQCPYAGIELPSGEIANQTGLYYEFSRASNGCDSTTIYDVNLDFDNCDYEDFCTIRLPDIFAPNGNSRNELFGPIVPLECMYANYNFQIYNRWGEMVFTSDSAFDKWDGRYNDIKAVADLYLYTLSYDLILPSGERIFQENHGGVSLVR